MSEQIWPPDYLRINQERAARLRQCNAHPELWQAAKAYYSQPEHCVTFIEDWCITYDPRNALNNMPTTMPFILFDKQKVFIDFLLDCMDMQANGLTEKCRDMGATWVCCAVSVWLWLFRSGASVGWGSRKEILVDKLGDPDSIFEKIRKLIEYLPKGLMPAGFNPKEHVAFMKIINPENEATITGEAGDNIGRGGRKLIYFKDESAHYQRPESIEAALSETTNVQIDISSVKGTGNVFHRNRMSGEMWQGKGTAKDGTTNIFVFDWRDHPAKTQEWYDKKKNDMSRRGLLHLFKQEVDRDYAGAVENTVILSEWVQAAIDSHIKLGIDIDGQTIAGLDVADEGVDKNALAVRKGVLLTFVEDWSEGDVGKTTRKALPMCQANKVNSLQYDCIGVGAGVKAETNRLAEEKKLPPHLSIEKWNAGAGVLMADENIIIGDDESPLWKDFAANLKAQAWWKLRERLEKTHQAVVQGIGHPHDELISISSTLPKIHELTNELTQVTYGHDGKLRIIINKKPSGTKSPNLADAVVMAFWPIIKAGFFV